jgi:uncharacterized surface anchored protein
MSRSLVRCLPITLLLVVLAGAVLFGAPLPQHSAAIAAATHVTAELPVTPTSDTDAVNAETATATVVITTTTAVEDEPSTIAAPTATTVTLPTEALTATAEFPDTSPTVVATEPMTTVSPVTVPPVATSEATGTATPPPTADVTAAGSPVMSGSSPVAAVEGAFATLTIDKVDQNGAPLTDGWRGACFSILHVAGTSRCDGDDGALDGTITLPAPVGPVTLYESRPPQGYPFPAAPKTALTIVAGGPNEVSIVNLPYDVLTVRKVDEHGKPLTDARGGACFELYFYIRVSSACDGDDGASDGLIHMLAVPGEFFLIEDRAPTGYSRAAYRSIEIIAGERNWVTVTDLPRPPQTLETLTIFKVDEHGKPLTDTAGGACFESVFRRACDGDDGHNDGTITMQLPAGTLEVVVDETRAPAGYFAPTSLFSVPIVAGSPNQITVVNQPLQTLTIFKVDERGEPLSDAGLGACFEGVTGRVCDADDGANDGKITVPGVPPGDLVLTEVRAPIGYLPAEPRTVTVTVDSPNEFVVSDTPAEILTVHKVDNQGAVATDDSYGACLYLIGVDAESSSTYACDGDDARNDGTILLSAAPGAYQLQESSPPIGYAMDNSPQSISVVAGGPNEATITNTTLEAVTVYAVDEQGAAITDSFQGPCFFLTTDAAGFGSYYDDSCDADDGTNDGRVSLAVPAGEAHLEEHRPPDGYFHAEARTVTILADGPNAVTVVHTAFPKLTVHKVDENGKPLTDDNVGACFTLITEYLDVYADTACDADDGANDGTITLTGAPGRGDLQESRAPTGYFVPFSWYPFLPFFVQISADRPNEVTVQNFFADLLPPTASPTATITPSAQATTVTPSVQATTVTPPAPTEPLPSTATAEPVGAVAELPNTGGGPGGSAGQTPMWLVLTLLMIGAGITGLRAKLLR